MKARGLWAVAGLTAIVVAGCGGGDGMMTSATPMPTTTTPPPMNPGNPMNPMNPMYPMSVPGEAAIGAFLQIRHESLLHDRGEATALAVSVPAAQHGAFNGFGPAYAATQLLTVRRDNRTASEPAMTHYFLAQPYVPLGKVGAGGNPYGIVTQTFGLPVTLRAGDAGPLDNLTYVHDANSSTAEATEITSYTVAVRDARSLRLCVTSRVNEVTPQGTADGLRAGSRTDCYAMTPAGAAELESVALESASGSLRLR
jgi:hypothetical protein